MSALIRKIPGLEHAIRRPPVLYAAARRLIERFEDMDAPQREAFWQERTGHILRKAGLSPPLQDLPFTTKADVLAKPEAYLHHTWWPVSKGKTSGTSGQSLAVSRSLNALVFEQAAIDWVVARAGGDFAADRIAVLRGADIKSPSDFSPPFSRLEADGRLLTVSSNHLSPASVKTIAAELQAFAPKIVYAYPSVIEYFANLCDQAGLEFHFQILVTSSEMFLPKTRERVSTFFGCVSADYYGQAERAAFAYSLKPEAYRFLGAYAVTEIEPAPSAEEGEIIGTSLHNLSQILPRYRSRDFVDLTQTPDDLRSVCLGISTFGGLRGRFSDVLVGNDKRTFVGIDHIPRGLEAYGRFQFIQERAGTVGIFLEGWSEKVKDKSDPVIERARMKLPGDFKISVHFVERLERTAAGKTPFVIRRF